MILVAICLSCSGVIAFGTFSGSEHTSGSAVSQPVPCGCKYVGENYVCHNYILAPESTPGDLGHNYIGPRP